MGLLKKKKKKKSAATMARFSGGGSSASEVSPLRPTAVTKQPPCIDHCPSGNDIRGWLTVIAQHEKTGLSLDDAQDKAWMMEAETTPFPAIMGRVCPHPCEGECNRKEKDSSVSINSVERFLGDWGIERKLALPKLDVGGPFEERVAIVGAGPSGLSCAYQLARRGYKVTVFESFEKPGGMLRYGIPEYRLPRTVIDAEVQKIVDLGVEIRYAERIGESLTLEGLRSDYDAVFVGIGAHKGWTMGIPGEDGPGVYTGTEFLHKVNAGDPVDIGRKVVVIGGGDTAIDAARVSLRLGPDSAAVSKRLGAEVHVLYRRTRAEMPAIEREIEEALEEGIAIDFLAAPVKILRDADGKMTGMTVQRMELGEPDDSGRRRPLPIEGEVYDVEADAVIMAVSQAPDWAALGGGIETKGSWLEVDDWGRTGLEGVWSGGDTLTLGLATISIGQGRKAAESIHLTLRGQEHTSPAPLPKIRPDRLKLDFYETSEPAKRQVLSPEQRLAAPFDEVDLGITAQQALEEVNRCFSCGLCFGCERCWMYCQVSVFKKVADPVPGHYYSANLATCDGCKKCAEECPCGFLDLI